MLERMLDRLSRTDSARGPAASAGPDEPTVRLARADFRRRRHAGRWRRVRTALVGLLVIAVVAAGAWVVFYSPYLTARQVDVSGNRTLSTARIETAAAVPTGTPLARLDLAAIAARVEQIPAVRDAQVSRSWPHDVRITVIERQPLAVVAVGSSLRALDVDGVLFGGFRARPPGLPLVHVAHGTRAEALAEVGQVIGSLPPLVAGKVDTVEVASVDAITLVLRGGRRVVWGSADQSTQKAEVLAILLRRPSQVIDVSVPGRPTTR